MFCILLSWHLNPSINFGFHIKFFFSAYSWKIYTKTPLNTLRTLSSTSENSKINKLPLHPPKDQGTKNKTPEPTSQRGINPHTTTWSAVLSIWITGSHSCRYHVHALFIFLFFANNNRGLHCSWMMMDGMMALRDVFNKYVIFVPFMSLDVKYIPWQKERGIGWTSKLVTKGSWFMVLKA